MKKEWKFDFYGSLLDVIFIYGGLILKLSVLSIVIGVGVTSIDLVFAYTDGEIKSDVQYFSLFKYSSLLFFIMMAAVIIPIIIKGFIAVFKRKKYYDNQNGDD